ncbi:uncharacterized protein LOC142560935 isoform X2 [Dermacentor variabilis]|uniref:uncharacterized protein LOC142560935 isoform X2 n=1 Tax=Dermacentor variabilis TaxID=34621 RepID=UPI003F5BA883
MIFWIWNKYGYLRNCDTTNFGYQEGNATATKLPWRAHLYWEIEASSPECASHMIFWMCWMMVPAYHPASNGAAERVVQTIKDKLKKSQTGDFRTQIARILFQYRTTLHDVTGRAPCELLLGRMVKTPLDVLHPHVQSTVLLKLLKQKLAADQGCHPGPLPELGVPIFARKFRPGSPWSAGQVVSPASASLLLVRMPDGATWHIHADHVRPRLVIWPAPSTATSELQPARGLVALPVTSSGAPPTLEVASIASDAALVEPVSSTAPLTRPTSAGPPDGVRLAQAAPSVATPGPSTVVPRRTTRR